MSGALHKKALELAQTQFKEHPKIQKVLGQECYLYSGGVAGSNGSLISVKRSGIAPECEEYVFSEEEMNVVNNGQCGTDVMLCHAEYMLGDGAKWFGKFYNFESLLCTSGYLNIPRFTHFIGKDSGLLTLVAFRQRDTAQDAEKVILSLIHLDPSISSCTQSGMPVVHSFVAFDISLDPFKGIHCLGKNIEVFVTCKQIPVHCSATLPLSTQKGNNKALIKHNILHIENIGYATLGVTYVKNQENAVVYDDQEYANRHDLAKYDIFDCFASSLLYAYYDVSILSSSILPLIKTPTEKNPENVFSYHGFCISFPLESCIASDGGKSEQQCQGYLESDDFWNKLVADTLNLRELSPDSCPGYF